MAVREKRAPTSLPIVTVHTEAIEQVWHKEGRRPVRRGGKALYEQGRALGRIRDECLVEAVQLKWVCWARAQARCYIGSAARRRARS
jgi:hypothetical protein